MRRKKTVSAGRALAALTALWALTGCASGRIDNRTRLVTLRSSDLPTGDRADYGQAPWPLWSVLTPAETQTLSRLSEAKSGDPAALLRLGLLASGDARTELEITKVASAVAEFADLLEAKLPDDPTGKERARTIFEAMHVRFFGSEKGHSLRNYEFAQSSLSGVFRDRRFNCVSSTMLYLILCRRFGLEAKGVLVPGHMFAQVDLADGTKVEVETTVLEGFGVVHDETFYRTQGKLLRRLYTEVPTFENYRNRKVMEPWQVMVENMANQHTDPSRMPIADIFRLREVRSFCWPGNLESARNRLSTYSMEATHLHKNSQWSDLVRFSETVLPWVSELKRTQAGDTSFATSFALSHAAYAAALIETGRLDEAKTWVDHSLAVADSTNTMFREIVQLDYAVMGRRWQALAGRGTFALVEGEINRYRETCPVQEACPEQRLWLYSEWIRSLWAKEKWEEVVAKLKLTIPIAGGSAQQYRESLDGAYSNWANSHFKAEQYAAGRKILERCLSESAENKNCAESLERLRQAGL